MKVFISVDMEGIHGAVSWSDMEGNGHQTVYENAWKELSWIVEGINRSKYNDEIREICICDSHARGEGIPFRSFGDSRINLIRGYPRPFYMLEGLDESFDLLMLVGYHAKIGALHGLMDHSYSSSCIYCVRLNGQEMSEADINGMLASHYGVPICFVSGDDILRKEIEEHFSILPIFVCTKQGLGRFAAKMYFEENLKPEFVEGAMQAIDRKDVFKPLNLAPVYDLEIDFASTAIADAVSVIPGLERMEGRRVLYRSTEMKSIYRMIHASAMLGGKFAAFT